MLMALTTKLDIPDTVVAKFAESATLTRKPKIEGGAYRAIDTQDGYYILQDVPVMGPVPKGEKNNSDPIGEEWLSGAVKFGQDSYALNKIAYPIHIGHNDDLGLTRPEFAGYFKPTKLGTHKVNGKEQPAVFADWKVKKSVFDRIQAGELPYHSPEIRNWSKQKISSLAILDSQPPYYPYPNMTVGEVVTDPTAKFDARTSDDEFRIIKFAEGREAVEVVKPPAECAKCKEYEAMLKTKTESESSAGGNMSEIVKPNAGPVEQAVVTEKAVDADKKGVDTAKMLVKMEDDPKIAAKFAALEDKQAALEKKIAERENVERARVLEGKALADLAGYQIGDKAKAQIAKFSLEGEDKLKELVETLKEVTPRAAAGTFAEAEERMSLSSDPILAKFADKGPDTLAKAADLLRGYRAITEKVKSYSLTAEQHIERGLKGLAK